MCWWTFGMWAQAVPLPKTSKNHNKYGRYQGIVVLHSQWGHKLESSSCSSRKGVKSRDNKRKLAHNTYLTSCHITLVRLSPTGPSLAAWASRLVYNWVTWSLSRMTGHMIILCELQPWTSTLNTHHNALSWCLF